VVIALGTDRKVVLRRSRAGCCARKTFYTTKQQGTGLGPSFARQIVESYGGKIWAENRIGGGAVFRFTLPLA
jgi:signal transduction histidine kinase